MSAKTNNLSRALSPYLLQHADNPVDWRMWSEEAFELAAASNKLVLISIGYSACHWCHVMEKESFSDKKVAALMNEKFICIKVDREEHPDVDHLYMEAVQIMTGQGGWPLNCFVLPDKRPVYGGTYFPRAEWMQLLEQLSNVYSNQSEKIYEYADKLTKGLLPPVLRRSNPENETLISSVENALSEARKMFDREWGGTIQVPKFPVPVGLDFLLSAGTLANDQLATHHVFNTLERMSEGGLYDQIGGGFARYSTDRYWKVPHFEKMLYDNAQLLATYSKAERKFRKGSFKNVVYGMFDFLKHELKSNTGAYYAALDADTEGEEGKFYTWTIDELKQIAGEEYALLERAYKLKPEDEWEGKLVLMKHQHMPSDLPELSLLNRKLLKVRNQRTRPAVDTKIICSWNALLISGLCEAYYTFKEPEFLDQAIETASFFTNQKELFHCYTGDSGYIPGYLEDYAFMARACLDLNRATADPEWLTRASVYCNTIMADFYDSSTGNFHLGKSSDLPVPVTDLYDSVMPSAASVACDVLITVGTLTGESEWIRKARELVYGVEGVFAKHPMSFGNWGMILVKEAFSKGELAITGPESKAHLSEINGKFLPALVVAGAKNKSELFIFKDRFDPEKNQFFLCRNNTCMAPVFSVSELEILIAE